MKRQRKDKGVKAAPGVYQLTEGRWRIMAAVLKDGVRTYREKVLGPEEAPTLQDAQIARAELVQAIKAGSATTCLPPPRGRPTVNDYAESWLKRRAPALKFSTSERYIEALAAWILPPLGGLYCEELSRGDIEDWVLWAEARRKANGRPYAQSSLNSWWRILCTFMADLAAEYERPSLTDRIRNPRSNIKTIRESRTLSSSELGALLQVIEEDHPQWLAEVTLLAFTGMRAGELYALRFDDVEEHMLHVRRTVYRGHEGSTKTDAPRTVALTPTLRQVVADHRAAMLRDQHPGLSSGLIFPSENGGFRGSQSLLNLLKLAGRKASLPVRVGPQVLRRTFNTLLLEQGVDRAVLRAQMGHSSEEMTMRYAGVRDDQKLSAVSDLIARVQGN